MGESYTTKFTIPRSTIRPDLVRPKVPALRCLQLQEPSKIKEEKMKKALERIKNELYYYKNNEKIIGIPSRLRGNVSGLRGDVNNCRITKREREKGVNIADLVK